MTVEPIRADDMEAAYGRLFDACEQLRHDLAAGLDVDQCLAEAKALGVGMAALPNPAQLLEVDDTERMNQLRQHLNRLKRAHDLVVKALQQRMRRQKAGAAQDHLRGGALKAYQGGQVPNPRFHDRRG